MEMALSLLLAAINKSTRNRIDVRDVDMLGMLDGLLPFLVRAMRSRHGAVASTALRVFSVLVPLPLPGKAKGAQDTVSGQICCFGKPMAVAHQCANSLEIIRDIWRLARASS